MSRDSVLALQHSHVCKEREARRHIRGVRGLRKPPEAYVIFTPRAVNRSYASGGSVVTYAFSLRCLLLPPCSASCTSCSSCNCQLFLPPPPLLHPVIGGVQ